MTNKTYMYTFSDKKYHSLLSIAHAPNDGYLVRQALPAILRSFSIPLSALEIKRTAEIEFIDNGDSHEIKITPTEQKTIDPNTAYNWSETLKTQDKGEEPTEIIENIQKEFAKQKEISKIKEANNQ